MQLGAVMSKAGVISLMAPAGLVCRRGLSNFVQFDSSRNDGGRCDRRTFRKVRVLVLIARESQRFSPLNRVLSSFSCLFACNMGPYLLPKTIENTASRSVGWYQEKTMEAARGVAIWPQACQ